MAKATKIVADSAVTVATAPSAPPATPSMKPDVHDASHQARLLREALQSDKVRIGFFLGAGCPLGIFDEKGAKSLGHIPDVNGLTTKLRERLVKHDESEDEEKKLCPVWDKLSDACKDEKVNKPNVEHILSELRTLCGRRGKSEVDGLTKNQLTSLDEKVCEFIADEVGKELPAHRCSYNRFASWVGGLQRVVPVEIFTPNYDLLIEEALEQLRIPHFDGFVGAREPFFDLSSIEQDAIPSRWTRLWKIHGSINWQKRSDGQVFRVAGKAAAGKAMIYPSHLKYDQSRRMPYLAMLDRLKAFFRSVGHGQGLGPPVLVICGYSFFDEHLNEVLLDGIRGNRSAHCFVLAYGKLSENSHVCKIAEEFPNLSLIAKDGAVVGTRIGGYRHTEGIDSASSPWLSEESVTEEGTGGTVTRTFSRMGDFHFFALFLEHLCGGRENVG